MSFLNNSNSSVLWDLGNPIDEFDCAEWCLEQHYTFQHNEIIATLFLPCIIFFFFAAYRFVDTDRKHFDLFKGINGEHNREVTKKYLAQTIRCFFYIFFGYLIYLVKWGALS